MRRPAAVLFPPAVLLFPSTPSSSAGVNWPHWNALGADVSAITGRGGIKANMRLPTSLGAVESNPATSKYQHLCCSNRFRQMVQPLRLLATMTLVMVSDKKTMTAQASHDSTLGCYIFIIMVNNYHVLKWFQTLSMFHPWCYLCIHNADAWL